MDVMSDTMLPELEEIDRPPGPGPGLLAREADGSDYPGPVMSPRLHHNNFISLGPPPPVPLIEYQGPDQTGSNFTQTFLRGILTSIDSKDPVVANAWLETLLDAIDLLPIEVIKQEIIIIAINKSQLSQPPFSRIASCKILGKLSTKLDQQANRQEILPSSLALPGDAPDSTRQGTGERLQRGLQWIWAQEGSPACRARGLAAGVFCGCFPFFAFFPAFPAVPVPFPSFQAPALSPSPPQCCETDSGRVSASP